MFAIFQQLRNFVVLAPLALLLACGGTSASGKDGGTMDAGGGRDTTNAGEKADGGCKSNGTESSSSCLSATECCSSFCDQMTHSCAPMVDGGACAAKGALCSVPAQCCSGNCTVQTCR